MAKAQPLLRRSEQSDEVKAAADRSYRRRVGRDAIRRAGKGVKQVESGVEKARTRLYNEMRAYADVFTEEELSEYSGVSRVTLRKRVLDKDQVVVEGKPDSDQAPSDDDPFIVGSPNGTETV